MGQEAGARPSSTTVESEAVVFVEPHLLGVQTEQHLPGVEIDVPGD